MDWRYSRTIVICLCLSPIASDLRSEEALCLLDDRLVHLRSGGDREWSSFPAQPDGENLDLTFDSAANDTTWTLSLRQQDVKQSWEVLINDRRIGRLVRDENDLRTDFEIPPRTLADGANRLQVLQVGKTDPDDIRVGEIEILTVNPRELRTGAELQVVITDQQDQMMPGRITVVDRAGTLIPIGAASSQGVAVREGVLYTAGGNVTFGLRPGSYRIYGGRGFEYGIESARIDLQPGDRAKRTLKLTRQVDTDGWIACDTHIHTVTHSGHGDCTIDERMATLAGEGIELPIATDHNTQVDYTEPADVAGAANYFTPVVGNEVTTKRGHFNIFPTRAEAPLPDHQSPDWKSLFDSIFSSPEVRVAILNHPRDLHSSFRPFSPRHHVSLFGANLDGFDRRFNAMEVINSGAVQTDPMQLFEDWCGLINHGMSVTPVGCSDSHDVSRFIVGQGRTYIAGNDSDVAHVDVGAAVEAFLQGRVVVSYGLFADLRANDSSGPGELVSLDPSQDNPAQDDPSRELAISLDVLGPAWTDVERIELWVNGRRRFTESVAPERSADKPAPRGSIKRRNLADGRGRKAAVHWSLPLSDLAGDVWITAVAIGPGVSAPYWPTAKPYQPDSIEFEPYVFTCTGPLWVDVDGDGRYTPPAGYARQLLADCGFVGDSSSDGAEGRWADLAARLGSVDASVVHQTVAWLHGRGLATDSLREAAEEPIRAEIDRAERAWQSSVRAQLEQIE